MRKTNNTEKPTLEQEEHSKNLITLDLSQYSYTPMVRYNNPKERLKVIKSIEKEVRSSLEYRSYLSYIKRELNASRCSFFKNLDLNDPEMSKDLTIEAHHYPFTLFDIALIILCKYEYLDNIVKDSKGSKVEQSSIKLETQAPKRTSFKIAEEIIKLHYEFKIGIVPLSKTAHELAHTEKLFISLDQVYGDIDLFIEEYRAYIPEEYLVTYSNLKAISRTTKGRVPNILVPSIQYIEMEGIGRIESLVKENNLLETTLTQTKKEI